MLSDSFFLFGVSGAVLVGGVAWVYFRATSPSCRPQTPKDTGRSARHPPFTTSRTPEPNTPVVFSSWHADSKAPPKADGLEKSPPRASSEAVWPNTPTMHTGPLSSAPPLTPSSRRTFAVCTSPRSFFTAVNKQKTVKPRRLEQYTRVGTTKGASLASSHHTDFWQTKTALLDSGCDGGGGDGGGGGD
jgi:hypothetical protein